MSLVAGIVVPAPAPAPAAAQAMPVRGQLLLPLAAFGCGCASAFSIDLLGQLFWAEILLPVVALGVLLTRFPAALFRNSSFRMLMFAIALMLIGYMVSDIAAHTPREMYLRGWARVAAFGISAFSLCVICHADRRCFLWFCLGAGAGGIAAGYLSGMPLTQWKLGYGEDAAYLAAASGALLPLWLASLVIALLGGVSVLLDYRSLGVVLMLVAAVVFLRSAKVDLRRLWRSLPLILVAVGSVAFAAHWLLNASEDDHRARRAVSNIGRMAALKVGALAIVDSPLIGYGSWGQGTEKYAAMLYDDVIDDLVAEDPDMQLRHGGVFTAHSQLIQAWMEGGVLAAAFFVAYIILLVRRLLRCVYSRPADPLTPLLLYVLATNLWAAVMSPFLGSQRITIALAVAAIVMLATEQVPAAAPEESTAGHEVPGRPANLMA